MLSAAHVLILHNSQRVFAKFNFKSEKPVVMICFSIWAEVSRNGATDTQDEFTGLELLITEAVLAETEMFR